MSRLSKKRGPGIVAGAVLVRGLTIFVTVRVAMGVTAMRMCMAAMAVIMRGGVPDMNVSSSFACR